VNKRHARTMIWASVDPVAPAPGTTPPAPPAPAPAAAPPEKTLTQTEVNAIVARETGAAREKAAKDLATQLGVTTEEAVAIIKAHTDKTNADKSDAQKAREAADAEKAKAVQEQEAARLEIHHTRADRELVKAGITFPEKSTEEQQDQILGRIRGLLTVQVGATAAEIAADVKAVKELYPALFTGTAGGAPPPPGSDPSTSGGGGPGTGGKTGIAAGMERARLQYERKSSDRPLPAGQRKTT
jgi:hypothetical protein